MTENNYPSENESFSPPKEESASAETSEQETEKFVLSEEKPVQPQTVYQTSPQTPPRYQAAGTPVYRQMPRTAENSRVYYQPVAPPSGAEVETRRSRSMPGVIGAGFASSLLSLFLIPFFHDFFPIFLNAYADPITYDREAYLMYFVLVMIYGGMSAMLALLGLIFAPLGINKARRYDLDGRALGTASILISVVSLLLLIVSIVSSLLINNML